MPETRAFSRQLVVYIAAFPPSAPYFKSNNGRISAVCNEQYSFTCRAEALFVSDDEEGADLILPDNRTSPTLELETLGDSSIGCVGHTPSKTSRIQPAPFRLICQARLCKKVYSH